MAEGGVWGGIPPRPERERDGEIRAAARRRVRKHQDSLRKTSEPLYISSSNRLGRLERGSSRQEGGRPAPQLPPI